MLKIILADNQAIFRAGAAKVLAVEDDFRIVAQCETADKVRGALENFRANVIILATSFRHEVPALIERALEYKARVIIVADSTETPDGYANLGITGFLYRNISGPLLVEAVRKTARGEVWIQNLAANPEFNETDIIGARVRDRLTAKELRIVALIVQGFKNKEIANQHGTTEQVVKNHLRSIYDKIGVSDRLELALFTIHHRILAEAVSSAAGANAGNGQRLQTAMTVNH